MKNFYKKINFVLVAATLIVGFFGFSLSAQAAPIDFGLAPIAASGLADTDIRQIIANIIKIALGLLGIGAVGLMMYAGYLWMTAGGNEEQIGTAKKVMVNAAIGLAIILSAYSIVSFVVTQLLDATGAGGGGSGLCLDPNGCDSSCDDPNGCPPANAFYVVSLPTQGNMCVRNVRPTVVFNKPVDISHLNGNLVIHNNGGDCNSPRFPGAWSADTNNPNIAIFTPENPSSPADARCPSGAGDCFLPNTEYVLHFCHPENIYEKDSDTVLNCAYGARCNSTAFSTGDKEDRSAPSSITIDNIQNNDQIAKGPTKPVYVSFIDDVGVKYINLKLDGNPVGDTTFLSCNINGTGTINLGTNNLSLGEHVLQAVGFDMSGNSASSSQVHIIIVPASCANGLQDADETGVDCGGSSCQVCDGSSCANDADCQSGYCYKNSPTDATGSCFARMYITSISPSSSAHGDLISIFGRNFGANAGAVYFKNNSDAWVRADLGCVNSNFRSWSNNQILVTVPSSSVSGPIKVETAPVVWPNGSTSTMTDETGAGSWKNHATDFVLSGISHPSLCGISPVSGQAGSTVTLSGRNFGDTKDLNDSVKFFELKALTSAWSNTGITAKSPLNLQNATFAVRVDKDGLSSNSVLYTVFGTPVNGPVITSLSSVSTTAGDYLTIYGNNFGNVRGNVIFYQINAQGLENTSNGVQGNINFPDFCKNYAWSNNQVVIKIPSGLSTGGKYAVHIQKADQSDNTVLVTSPFDPDIFVNMVSGDPAPGICDISPESDTVPGGITIYGENFSTNDESKTKVYFSKLNSKASDLSTFENVTVSASDIQSVSGGGQIVSVTTTANVASGPLFAVTAQGRKGNSVAFRVFDCTAKGNNNTCTVSGQTCCASDGPNKGACVSAGQVCGDEHKSSGYMWLFSTNKLVPFPTVVERCDDSTNSGSALPSPSPATYWGGESKQVCRTALPTVEFSAPMKPASFTGNISVYSCGDTEDFSQSNCAAAFSASLVYGDANALGNSYIQLTPNSSDKRWTANRWYQVRLSTNIKSAANMNLQATRSCVSGTAYCYTFKTGSDDCNLKQIMITPTSFWTSIIDAANPIKVRNIGSEPYDLVYRGNGISGQRCTMMQVGNLAWNWSSASTTFASTTRADLPASTDLNLTKALAFKNTVEVGLSDDFVNIQAQVPRFGTCNSNSLIKCSSNSDCNYFINSWEGYSYIQTKSGACGALLKKRTGGIGYKFYLDFAASVASNNHVLQCDVASDCNTNGFNTWFDAISIEGWNTKEIYCYDNTSTKTPVSSTCSSGGALESFSPLTIDLTRPEVTDYAPNCLEACANATVYVRFNTSMSNFNLSSINSASPSSADALRLYKCGDENCNSTTQVGLSGISLDSSDSSHRTIIINSSQSLSTGTLYKVEVSSVSAAGTLPTSQLWSGSSAGERVRPFNQVFSWRFRTKKDLCQANRVDVLPQVYTAKTLRDKTIFTGDIYTAPDACSAEGQRLNSWNLAWNWSSSNTDIAIVRTSTTTGKNPFCTGVCTKVGSSIPFTTSSAATYPVCGNGIVEAGEDCDDPASSTNPNIACQLNCLKPKNLRKTGSVSSPNSTDTNASICGNGLVGATEDCDIGISSNKNNPLSSLLCSNSCLHQGTRLSDAWCTNTASTSASGFSVSEINKFCSSSYSQCGDGVLSPSEDAVCDGAGVTYNPAICDDRCVKKNQCTPNTEGCGADGRYLGSSLLYETSGQPTPSVCGDAVPGIGEDPTCETLQPYMLYSHTVTDPWVLVVGNGSTASGSSSPFQFSNINATASTGTINVSGSGRYQIKCGYRSDDDCAATFDQDYALANNSCCVARSQVTSVYPGYANNGTPASKSPASGVCINTHIQADFDSVIDGSTLQGNFIIARGIASGNCPVGTTDVTAFVKMSDGPTGNLSWYQKLWGKLLAFVKGIFGETVSAVNVTKWCAGSDLGSAKVVANAANTTSSVMFSLQKALSPNTDYAVILKDSIKDTNGVGIQHGIGSSTSSKSMFGWRFSTGPSICEVDKVEVDPSADYFSRPDEMHSFVASAVSTNNQLITPVQGYSWQYVWGPSNSPYFTVSSTGDSKVVEVTSKNRNGESDLFASLELTENQYTSKFGTLATGKSHIVVFLCANPWPPKPGSENSSSTGMIFPYQDIFGNNDGFSLQNNIFDGSAIPASAVYKGGYFNFQTYYCADNGNAGAADDLPYLKPAVQSSNTILGGVDSVDNLTVARDALKRFFFTNDKNNDAVGIQVFDNPKHLSISGWFKDQGFVGNLQNIQVDGYPAMTDGSNIYVNALNFASASADQQNTGNLSSNIYLFSISSGAKPETKKVFEQIINNLSFNANLSNFGYCGTNISTVDAEKQTACQSDFDCAGITHCEQTVENKSVCANDHSRSCSNAANDCTALSYDASAECKFATKKVCSSDNVTGCNMDSDCLSVGGTIDGILINQNGGVLFKPKNVALPEVKDHLPSGFCGVTPVGGSLLQNEVFMNAKGEMGSDGEYVLYDLNESDVAVCSTDQDCTNAKTSGSPNYSAPFNNWVSGKASYSNSNGSQYNFNLKCFTVAAPTFTLHYASEGPAPTCKEISDSNKVCSNDSGASCATDSDCKTKYDTCETVTTIKYNNCVGEVCANQKDKLRRNYQRLLDMTVFDTALSSYFEKNQSYPDLKSGTYLSGQTISTWPSWGVLGSALSQAMPVDPVNKLGTAGTCSVSTNKFCNSNADCATDSNFYTCSHSKNYVCNNDSECPGTLAATQVSYVEKVVNGTPEITTLEISANSLTKTGFCRLQLKNNTNGGGTIFYDAAKKDSLQDNFGTLSCEKAKDCEDAYFATPNGGYLRTWWQSLKFSNLIDGDSNLGFVCQPYNTLNTFTANTCNIPENAEKCIPHDPVTGWSTADRRFSFACTNPSLAYRYIATSTTNYQVRAHFEYTGLNINNNLDFVSSFIPASAQAHFNATDFSSSNSTICRQNNEIATFAQGGCGDGKVQYGEDCDPPGSLRYHTEQCTGSVTQMNVDICGAKDTPSACKWIANTVPTSSCQIVSKCGNGKVEYGEVCDDGLQNGKYNHCNAACSGFAASCGDGVVSSTYEFCDIGSGISHGICAGGAVVPGTPCDNDNGCIYGTDSYYNSSLSLTTNAAGSCVKWLDTNTLTQDQFWALNPGATYRQIVPNGKAKYGINKTSSCNSDCQKSGPYCGDGVVDTAYGEECDGSQTCSVGVAGQRTCNTQCRWVYENATSSPISYFDFNEPVYLNGDSSKTFIKNKGVAGKPSSVFGGLFCVGDGSAGCPSQAPSRNAGRDLAMNFNGTTNFFNISDGTPGIYDLNAITIAAWVNIPSTTSVGSKLPIVSKSSEESGKDNDFYLYLDVVSSSGANLSFTSLKTSNSDKIFGTAATGPIDGKPVVSFDSWHFVAVTVDENRNGYLYVDGVSSNFNNGTSTLKADNSSSQNTFIGKKDHKSGLVSHFKGLMDDVQVFGRALSAAEINDLKGHSASMCQPNTVSAPTDIVSQPNCGNGKIETNEDCDNGSNNGVACNPSYGNSCSYCSGTCKIVVVSPQQYCGDGKVGGSEKCDADANDPSSIYYISTTTGSNIWWLGTNNTLTSGYGYRVSKCSEEYNTNLNLTTMAYSSASLPNPSTVLHTFKTGTKSCSSDCAALSQKCISCGLISPGKGVVPGAVNVAGTVMNVLETSSGKTNPLYATGSSMAKLSLVYASSTIGSVDNSTVAINWKDPASATSPDYYLSPFAGNSFWQNYKNDQASINPNSLCSSQVDSQSSYRLVVNDDTSRSFKFPVLSGSSKDAFDLILSPIIQKSVRANDVRVVVSWVGDSQQFHAGFASLGLVGGLYLQQDTDLNSSAGKNYFDSVSSSAAWYHGWNISRHDSTGLNEISFTFNSNDLNQAAYPFFVKSASTINSNNKNSFAAYKLKVEVYLPEDCTDSDCYRKFSRPSKVFYLDNSVNYAEGSATGAYYWHMFNIKNTNGKAVSSLNDFISTTTLNITTSNIQASY